MEKKDLDEEFLTLHNYALIRASGSLFNIHNLVHRNLFEYLRSDPDALQQSMKDAARVVDTSVRRINNLQSGRGSNGRDPFYEFCDLYKRFSVSLGRLAEQTDDIWILIKA